MGPIPTPNEPMVPSVLEAASAPNSNPVAKPSRLNPKSPRRNPKSSRRNPKSRCRNPKSPCRNPEPPSRNRIRSLSTSTTTKKKSKFDINHS